jgi:hypothetical protein
MTIPFACDMTAIPADLRATHQRLIRRLMSDAVEEVKELPDGFAFRFPSDEYDALTEFVGRERLCCPFLTFTLEVAPDHRPLLLRITGSEGAKDFIRSELRL